MTLRDVRGQASVLLLGVICAVGVGAVVLAIVAGAVTGHGDRQRAADLGALAAAAAMRDAYPRLYPWDGTVGLSPDAYRAAARRAAERTVRANDQDGAVAVAFPDGGEDVGGAPLRVRVRVAGAGTSGGLPEAAAVAEAELRVPATTAAFGGGGAGEYKGPLSYRDGKPMRPDVALAYDRMAAAARADGVSLVVVSGWRGDAEQARLFAAHPDPKWVARPGTSLHRLGTELDLGPANAYGWLAAHANAFGFLKRYSWEPWHFGFVRNAGSASVGYGGRASTSGGERSGSSLPAFIPARYAPILARAAQRWNVSAVLLGAQVRAESDFDPRSVSSAGALGIAQLMPENVREMGVTDPFDPAQSINAQAHMMRDLLRRFGSVPLALAAYNAGPGRVGACMCVPPYPETQAYVARILGLLRGAGDGAGLAVEGMEVRLTR